MNEAKLARKLRQGDRLALNQAIDAYTPYLTTVVWHTIGPTASAEDVEEIISDVFLAGISSGGRWRVRARRPAWTADG